MSDCAWCILPDPAPLLLPCCIPSPGGPQLEALAATADEAGRVAFKGRVALPLRQDRDSCNFSFSGVKTSVAALIDKELPKGQQQQQEEEEEEGAGAQEAAAEQLQK
jgi:tRNA A37 threonylcarbamoyltransferase TsaD